MEGNQGVVGESATPEGGGGFVSITSNSLSNRDDLASETGDFGHEQRNSPVSTLSI
jgi:hypothetical protein